MVCAISRYLWDLFVDNSCCGSTLICMHCLFVDIWNNDLVCCSAGVHAFSSLLLAYVAKAVIFCYIRQKKLSFCYLGIDLSNHFPDLSNHLLLNLFFNDLIVVFLGLSLSLVIYLLLNPPYWYFSLHVGYGQTILDNITSFFLQWKWY